LCIDYTKKKPTKQYQSQREDLKRIRQCDVN
jgi:hypothetical protein